VAVVTGGARGLGRGIAEVLEQAGARVISLDRDPAADDGAPGQELIVDVADPVAIRNCLQSVAAEYGGLDILINNAGVAQNVVFEEITPADWERVMTVNAGGAFYCAQAGFELMKGRGSGRIIQISSVTAFQGSLHGHAHYSASKAALLGLTTSLARVAAPYGITCNAIAPGVIDTDLLRRTHPPDRLAAVAAGIPLGIGAATDVGHAVAFLCSDEARYLTGVTLDVNGGQYLRP
jgi:3-oxoacyl-[acyl-carrier protein] reductase